VTNSCGRVASVYGPDEASRYARSVRLRVSNNTRNDRQRPTRRKAKGLNDTDDQTGSLLKGLCVGSTGSDQTSL